MYLLYWPPSSPAENAGWVARGCVARGPCVLGRVIRARGGYWGCMECRLVARARSAETREGRGGPPSARRSRGTYIEGARSARRAGFELRRDQRDLGATGATGRVPNRAAGSGERGRFRPGAIGTVTGTDHGPLMSSASQGHPLFFGAHPNCCKWNTRNTHFYCTIGNLCSMACLYSPIKNHDIKKNYGKPTVEPTVSWAS